MLLNVIIGQASGGLIKPTERLDWQRVCHILCVCFSVCVCAIETSFLLHCLGRFGGDPGSGPCERVSVSNRATVRVVNNPAHTPGKLSLCLLM